MRSSATIFFLISVLWANGQSDELIIQGQTGGLYLEHTVVPKETWYSVGRMYNVDPKLLAKYNQLTFAHSLVIGEELKVPLTAVNLSQDGKKLAGEALVPVYHVVQEKEWLYRISVDHNKVPIPVLEKWNHVTGDQVHVGLHMVVGYLKVKAALSALAKGGVVAPGGGSLEAGADAAGGGAATTGGGAASAGGVSKTGNAAPAAGVAKAVMPPAGTKNKLDTAVGSAPEVRHKVMETGSAAPVASTMTAPVASTAVASGGSTAGTSVAPSAPHFNGGKFRADYSDGGKMVSGQAGIFKSTSGWQDGKYYALINNVPVGTIVKITDQATSKSVYAKVLGPLPEMKESAGLTIRLSNSAAAELGQGDGRFSVAVGY